MAYTVGGLLYIKGCLATNIEKDAFGNEWTRDEYGRNLKRSLWGPWVDVDDLGRPVPTLQEHTDQLFKK